MTDPLTIAIASDHAGLELKRHMIDAAEQWRVQLSDLGPADMTSVDYPDYAHLLAQGITRGTYRLGILVCGTGLGMSMAANRHPGVRAAVCTETFAARMARQHNNANVLCLGARVVGVGLAEDIVREFLAHDFEGGRHARRVDKIELPS
ncbi:MAG: ribose 5-phosphate isomerase B [Myxococcales bacterium]|nr:ribose 5-phosphate isomerase B [Myxococcales bacterium]MDD9971238.1 ribose 5-phosphate isomerase B [Myxococcales bacterium]